MEEQKRQRRGQEDQPRNTGQEVQHRVDVADALRQLQPFTKQRVIKAEYLHHPARPADALADMRRQALRRQAGRLRNTHIGRSVPATMQAQRGVGVFGDRFHGNAADFIQRAAADHRTGAAEEGGIPHVVAVLHQAIKQRAFVRRFAKTPQVTFKRVWREEVVRRLHHRQLFLLQEPAHGHLQERAGRHVVAVENRHKLAFGVLQRIVDIPGFRVFVRGARDVMHANVFGELAELFAPAVIEDPDIKLVLRPVDPLRGVNGVFHHVEIFVISRHEDIDRRPLRHIFRQRNRLTVQRPDDLEIAQHQHHPGVGFSEQQDYPAHQAYGVVPV